MAALLASRGPALGGGYSGPLTNMQQQGDLLAGKTLFALCKGRINDQLAPARGKTVGALKTGGTMTVLESRMLPDGTLRVRCAKGWVTARTEDPHRKYLDVEMNVSGASIGAPTLVAHQDFDCHAMMEKVREEYGDDSDEYLAMKEQAEAKARALNAAPLRRKARTLTGQMAERKADFEAAGISTASPQWGDQASLAGEIKQSPRKEKKKSGWRAKLFRKGDDTTDAARPALANVSNSPQVPGKAAQPAAAAAGLGAKLATMSSRVADENGRAEVLGSESSAASSTGSVFSGFISACSSESGSYRSGAAARKARLQSWIPRRGAAAHTLTLRSGRSPNFEHHLGREHSEPTDFLNWPLVRSSLWPPHSTLTLTLTNPNPQIVGRPSPKLAGDGHLSVFEDQPPQASPLSALERELYSGPTPPAASPLTALEQELERADSIPPPVRRRRKSAPRLVCLLVARRSDTARGGWNRVAGLTDERVRWLWDAGPDQHPEHRQQCDRRTDSLTAAPALRWVSGASRCRGPTTIPSLPCCCSRHRRAELMFPDRLSLLMPVCRKLRACVRHCARIHGPAPSRWRLLESRPGRRLALPIQRPWLRSLRRDRPTSTGRRRRWPMSSRQSSNAHPCCGVCSLPQPADTARCANPAAHASNCMQLIGSTLPVLTCRAISLSRLA